MKKFGLIGNNISYSLSPKIHGLIFDCFGLRDYSYEIIDICKDDLEKKFSDLKKNYSGFNITIPYKVTIANYIEKSFSPILAVNTVTSKNGETYGYNTDIDGFRHHFSAFCKLLAGEGDPSSNVGITDMNNVEKSGYYDQIDNVLVIGAGGAAETAIYVMKSFGLNMSVKARHMEKVDRLVKRYNISTDYKNVRPKLIVNASGKNTVSDHLLDDIDTKELVALYDFSYNYKESEAHFSRCGVAYTDGLDMLIYQAIYAAKLLYSIDKIDIQRLFAFISDNLKEAHIV